MCNYILLWLAVYSRQIAVATRKKSLIGEALTFPNTRRTCDRFKQNLGEPPSCLCSKPEEQDPICSKLASIGNIKDSIKSVTGTWANVSASLSLRLVEAQNTTEEARRLVRTVRRAVDGMPDLRYRNGICGLYDSSGKEITDFLFNEDGPSAIFVVEAVPSDASDSGPVAVGTAGIRERSRQHVKYAELHKEFEQAQCGPLTDNMRIAEVGAVYIDVSCQGMGIGGWLMDAALDRAGKWGMHRLVLRSTPGALNMYKAKYGFVQTSSPSIVGSTPMALNIPHDVPSPL